MGEKKRYLRVNEQSLIDFNRCISLNKLSLF